MGRGTIRIRLGTLPEYQGQQAVAADGKSLRNAPGKGQNMLSTLVVRRCSPGVPYPIPKTPARRYKLGVIGDPLPARDQFAVQFLRGTLVRAETVISVGRRSLNSAQWVTRTN
jgi:hypothetical protein